MNKRNSLFSPSAYLESLRQTRLTGLIYLVCCLLFSFLPALISSVSGSSFAPNLVDYAGVLFAYIFLAPLTLVFSSFGFLTRRSASDFYHSLPIRRSTLYVSRVLAILTWLAGTVVLSLLSSYLTYGLFGRVLNWAQLPYLIGYFFSCCLLVTACALIGICSTGTYFSAFIVAGLVMFLPRFISFLIAEMVESSAPIVSVAELGFLFNYNLNLPVALIAELFSFGFYGAIDLKDLIIARHRSGRDDGDREIYRLHGAAGADLSGGCGCDLLPPRVGNRLQERSQPRDAAPIPLRDLAAAVSGFRHDAGVLTAR